MFDPTLRGETARAVKEAHEILSHMRTVTFASVIAEEASRKAIRESRDLLLSCVDGDASG